MEHRRLSNRSINEIGQATVFVAANRDIDLDGSKRLLRESPGDGGVLGLAADHEDLI